MDPKTPPSPRSGPPRRRGGALGFSLVELLIAVTLAGIVVAAALALFDTQQETARAEDIRQQLQQNSRYALDLLRRDLQEAGEGMDPAPVFGVAAMGDGGATPDTVYTVFVEPETDTHDTQAPAANPGFEKDSAKLVIRCDDPVDDVEQGDFLYFATATKRGLAVVRGTDQVITGTCGPSDPAGKKIGVLRLGIASVDGEGHGWVLQGNEAGAAAVRAVAVAYFVDDTDPNRLRLVRATRYSDAGEWTGRPLAEGVSDLQATLVFADGSTGVAADGTDADTENDYDDINTVRIRLEAQALRTDRALLEGQRLQRSYAISVSPRNQIYTRNLEN